jgi:hypothetical protein
VVDSHPKWIEVFPLVFPLVLYEEVYCCCCFSSFLFVVFVLIQ